VLKKISDNFVLVLIFIAVLVLIYIFITRGIPGLGGKPGISPETSVVNTANTIGTEKPVAQTSGSVASSKITLTITSPINDANLDSTNATVKGKTSPNADVFVNDVTGKADANGNFAINIGLDEGSNLIIVSANDSVGNATQTEITVTVASFQ
jgi:hypothetical protein